MLQNTELDSQSSSSKETENEVGIAGLLGITNGDYEEDTDNEVLLIDTDYLRDASDFDPVTIKVAEFKKEAFFSTPKPF